MKSESAASLCLFWFGHIWPSVKEAALSAREREDKLEHQSEGPSTQEPALGERPVGFKNIKLGSLF